MRFVGKIARAHPIALADRIVRLAQKIPHFLDQVFLRRIELPAGSKLQILLRSLNICGGALFIRALLLRR